MLETCFETSRISVSSLAAPSSAVAVPTDAAANASTHAATANARVMYPFKAALLRPQLSCARTASRTHQAGDHARPHPLIGGIGRRKPSDEGRSAHHAAVVQLRGWTRPTTLRSTERAQRARCVRERGFRSHPPTCGEVP